jgi:hypothetical protein
METNKKTIIGVFSMLLVGIALVSASSYFSMNELHQRMMASDDFEAMHTAMISGDFEAAEKYHETLDFECPMHELVKEGNISTDEFQVMHQWMISGDFPQEKPKEISNAGWQLHKSHHPESYK